MRTAAGEKGDYLKILLKAGAIRPEVLDYIDEDRLCDYYGWTPDYVRSMDIETFYIYQAILAGKRDKGQTRRLF